jgi:hypothetical protein
VYNVSVSLGIDEAIEKNEIKDWTVSLLVALASYS